MLYSVWNAYNEKYVDQSRNNPNKKKRNILCHKLMTIFKNIDSNPLNEKKVSGHLSYVKKQNSIRFGSDISKFVFFGPFLVMF